MCDIIGFSIAIIGLFLTKYHAGAMLTVKGGVRRGGWKYHIVGREGDGAAAASELVKKAAVAQGAVGAVRLSEEYRVRPSDHHADV